MKLHTLVLCQSLLRAGNSQRSGGRTTRGSGAATSHGAALAALSLAVLALVGCGGSENTRTEDSADELVSVQPAGPAIPEAIADQLMAEELAGVKTSAPAAAGKASAEWLGQNSKGFCLPAVTNPVYRWNELALDAVRSAAMSDAQSARLYAMVNVAMYDAVNGIETRRGSRRAPALVPATGAPRDGSLYAAASAAALAVLTQLNPAQASVYAAQHQADLAALRHGSAKAAGAAWGTSVGNQVVALRQADGSALSETLPAGTGPGVFRAAWSGTQFRNLTPFVIAHPSAYVQSSRPALTSAAYAAAFNDVKTVGSAAIPNAWALETYQFWASSAGTSQPPGEWVKVALMMTRKKDLSVPDSARLMALMGMGLSDAVAPALSTKFNLRSWRPTTAIREADTDGNGATTADTAWSARGGSVGSSPEYISGHSAFAGVGSTVLRGFFCDDTIRFTLQTDGATNGARTYETFSAAEAESGRSRVLGGVHFEYSNQDGLKLGRGVGDEVLAKALLYTHGDTHRGRCPR